MTLPRKTRRFLPAALILAGAGLAAACTTSSVAQEAATQGEDRGAGRVSTAAVASGAPSGPESDAESGAAPAPDEVAAPAGANLFAASLAPGRGDA